jgi:hypothetical protein
MLSTRFFDRTGFPEKTVFKGDAGDGVALSGAAPGFDGGYESGPLDAGKIGAEVGAILD